MRLVQAAGWQAGGQANKRALVGNAKHVSTYTKNFELSTAKQRQKSESGRAKCGMQWCCCDCYACGWCYCCSVCIVWCPDVIQSQMNVRYSINTKKIKIHPIKKTERKACALISYPSLCMSYILLAFACLTIRFFPLIPSIDLMDVCVQQTNAFNRPQISWVIYVPNESRIENLCQPEKNTAQHSKCLYRIEYFLLLRLTSLRQETILKSKSELNVFEFMLLEWFFDAFAESRSQNHVVPCHGT